MSKNLSGNLIADLHTDDGRVIPVLVQSFQEYEYLFTEDGTDYYEYGVMPTAREIRVGDTVAIVDTGEYRLGVVVQKTVGEGDMITVVKIREVEL